MAMTTLAPIQRLRLLRELERKVLWLSACTVGALAWLFHRAGLLEAGLAAVLARLADLPAEARALFLLPYAMTAYVAWRTKEAAFRRAAGSGA